MNCIQWTWEVLHMLTHHSVIREKIWMASDSGNKGIGVTIYRAENITFQHFMLLI